MESDGILSHIGLIIFIRPPHMAFPIHPENRATFLPPRPPHLAAQVDIPGIQQACINIGVDGAVRDRQFIPVPFTDGWKGLPFLQQRGNRIIDPVQLLFCQGDPLAGLRKGLLVLFLGILCIIKHTAQPAAEPVVARIADKRGFFS